MILGETEPPFNTSFKPRKNHNNILLFAHGWIYTKISTMQIIFSNAKR